MKQTVPMVLMTEKRESYPKESRSARPATRFPKWMKRISIIHVSGGSVRVRLISWSISFAMSVSTWPSIFKRVLDPLLAVVGWVEILILKFFMYEYYWCCVLFKVTLHISKLSCIMNNLTACMCWTVPELKIMSLMFCIKMGCIVPIFMLIKKK